MKYASLALLAAGIAAILYWSWPVSDPGPIEDVAGESPRAGRDDRTGDPLEASGRVGPSRNPETGRLNREQVEGATPGVTSDDLVVRVVDSNGRGLAGVRIALSAESRIRDASLSVSVTQRTDDVGRAVFRTSRKDLVASKSTWFLVSDVLFDPQPFLKLDSKTLARDVVEFVLPPFGSVEVVAENEDGSPTRDLTTAALALVDPREAEDPTLAFSRKTWSRKFVDGRDRVRFDYVQLDSEWAAAVSRAGAEATSNARGPGPKLQDQNRRITVSLGLDRLVAVFRAVDERGAPIVKNRLYVGVHWQWGPSTACEVVTDAAGQFVLDVDRNHIFGQYIEVAWPGKLPEVVGPDDRSGAAWIPRKLETGRTDCGDVVLYPPTPLVSGRVVDAAGKAVSGVTVRACGEVRHAGVQFSHTGGHGVEGVTGEDGAFALSGVLPHEEFHVYVDGEKRRSAPVKARRGDTGKVLTCRDLLVPSIRVLLGKDVSEEGLLFELRPAEAKEGGVKTSLAEREGGVGQAQLPAVLGGLYDLTYSLRSRVLGRRDGIRIDKSGPIATVDLRRELFRHVVHVPAAAKLVGQFSGTVFWQPSDSTKSWDNTQFDGTPIVFTSASPSVNLRVYPQGYREEVRRNVTAPQTIRLRPALAVRLVLRTTGTLPKLPYVFGVMPRVLGQEVGKPVGSRYFTETKREAVFLLPAGRVEVGWHMERRRGNEDVGGGVLNEHRVVIDVKDSIAEQEFQLDLDATALNRLVKKPPF